MKDHLGNSRVSFADLNWDGVITIGGEESEVTEENHYYPFGMNMEGEWASQIGPNNKYQYNGKELNDDFGLSWNDYGARFYDAAIGRWTTVDPLAERYKPFSPYVYAANNPIKFIDPDGRKIKLGKYNKKKHWSRKEYRKYKKEVLAKAQALTNDKLKLRGRTIKIKKKGGANKGKNLSEGTKLISDVISSKKTAVIANTNGGNLTKPTDHKASRNGKGSNALILFDPTNRKGGIDVNGNRDRDPSIGLAHELIHADNILHGTRGRARLPNLYDPDTNGKRVLTDEEVNTRTRENIIREEQGAVPRKMPKPKDE